MTVRDKTRINPAALVVVTGLCTVMLFVLIGYRWTAQEPLQAPVPQDLDKLDPQLRAYISEKVQWVRAAPREMQRHATLGITYAANSLWQEARLAFQNAVRLNPKEPLACMYVGIATQEMGDFAEALTIFQQLTSRFPNFAPGYYRLGEASLKAGELVSAENAFRRLVELAPKEWRGFAGVGDVRLRKNEFSEAARWLEKAVQLDWSAAKAHHLLGMALRGEGRMQEAELELSLGFNAAFYPMSDAWSEAAPEHMKLLQDQLAIADECAQRGQPQKAVGILESALSFHPTNTTVLNNLAVAYNRSNAPQKARPLLLRILQSDSHYLPAYITMSFTCQLLGSNEEALTYAQRAIALAPGTAQAHVAKANALLAMERDIEAVAALEEGFRCDPKNADIQIELGDVCWRNLKRPADALEHYKKAVQLDRSLVRAHLRLAELAIERGTPAEARTAVDLVRKLAPAEPGLVILERRLQKTVKQ